MLGSNECLDVNSRCVFKDCIVCQFLYRVFHGGVLYIQVPVDKCPSVVHEDLISARIS